MTPRDCPRFDGCDAPLCPMDGDRAKRTWFPDEPICTREGMGTTRFVKIQKRLARAVVLTDTFFTVPMLEAVTAVTPATAGLDADSTADRQHRELEWIKKHRRGPGRVWTQAQREAAKERLMRGRLLAKTPNRQWEDAPEAQTDNAPSTPSPTP